MLVGHAAGVLSPSTAKQERQKPQDQEYEEQNLRDTRSSAGYPSEAKNRGNQGNDQKYKRPVEHGIWMVLGFGWNSNRGSTQHASFGSNRFARIMPDEEGSNLARCPWI